MSAIKRLKKKTKIKVNTGLIKLKQQQHIAQAIFGKVNLIFQQKFLNQNLILQKRDLHL